MIETLTIITLSILALIIFRPGKTEPLDNPLVINRIGQFHAVLAPKINLAQPFLENVSRHLGEQERQSGNTQPLYLKVSDREVKAHGQDFYLLAATLRDGVLYFQATAPDNNRSDLDTLRAFSEAELSHHPASTVVHSDMAENALSAAIQAAANQRGAILTKL
jgi:hypothetical protein